MKFKLSDAEGYTYTIQDGTLDVARGAEGEAKCVVETDTSTAIAVFTGKMDGMQAFMSGKLKATNRNDMAKFGEVFKGY